MATRGTYGSAKGIFAADEAVVRAETVHGEHVGFAFRKALLSLKEKDLVRLPDRGPGQAVWPDAARVTLTPTSVAWIDANT